MARLTEEEFKRLGQGRTRPEEKPEPSAWTDEPRIPKWEDAYEREVLHPGRISGDVLDWRWHPFRFVLSPGQKQSYEPDFLVCFRGGELVVVEVKGFERGDSIEKFKTAAEQHPWFTFRMVTREKGGRWETTREIPRSWSVKRVDGGEA